jgi:hypothetical protein
MDVSTRSDGASRNWCSAVCLDGPFAGERMYATNVLGSQVEVKTPPTPGGARFTYELVRLAVEDEPAQLRYMS